MQIKKLYKTIQLQKSQKGRGERENRGFAYKKTKMSKSKHFTAIKCGKLQVWQLWYELQRQTLGVLVHGYLPHGVIATIMTVYWVMWRIMYAYWNNEAIAGSFWAKSPVLGRYRESSINLICESQNIHCATFTIYFFLCCLATCPQHNFPLSCGSLVVHGVLPCYVLLQNYCCSATEFHSLQTMWLCAPRTVRNMFTYATTSNVRIMFTNHWGGYLEANAIGNLSTPRRGRRWLWQRA